MMQIKKKQVLIKSSCYCGCVDQNEFIQRFMLIKNRIKNFYSRRDLAFLMGRTPYFINDYEEFSITTKLNLQDLDLLSSIFRIIDFNSVVFDTKVQKVDVSREKRMVRVLSQEFEDQILYTFYHPWTLYGSPVNLKIIEPKFNLSLPSQEQIEKVKQVVLDLIASGYFIVPRSPLEIYLSVSQILKYHIDAWAPVILNDIMYIFIRENIIYAKITQDRFNFLIKH